MPDSDEEFKKNWLDYLLIFGMLGLIGGWCAFSLIWMLYW